MADKSVEIVAIPKLLDTLMIEWAIMRSDAMGFQRAVAQKTIDKMSRLYLRVKR